MYFQALQLRLIAILKGRIRSGELTERRLARMTGISQPHIHNVLKGARLLSPESADQILESLKISIFDLLQGEELDGIRRPEANWGLCYEEVPVLEGRIGPGFPFPGRESPFERLPFPRSQLAAVGSPVAVRVAADAGMAAWFAQDDLVLLDRAPEKRRNIDPAALYVVATGNGTAVRRLRVLGGHLHSGVGIFTGGEGWDCILPGGEDILDVVLAKVVWIGRNVERNGGAGKTAQETGGENRSSDRDR
jgi:transcriptional regulator with XRE-family HTH domain